MNKTEIVISGNIVSLVNTSIERSISYEDFIAGILKDAPLVTPVLPPNCMMYTRVGDTHFFAQFINGGKRTFTYPEQFTTFNMPPHVFIVQIATNGSVIDVEAYGLDTEKQLLCYPCLPNIDRYMKVCFGGVRLKVNPLLHRAVHDVVDVYFKTQYNHDLDTNITLYDLSKENIELKPLKLSNGEQLTLEKRMQNARISAYNQIC